MADAGDQASLQRHLDWLYGEGGVYPRAGEPCRCNHVWGPLGRLYGVSMGSGWLRSTTHPDCPHHGRRAEAERRDRNKSIRPPRHHRLMSVSRTEEDDRG